VSEVLIGRDKYVICCVCLFIHMVAATVDTLCAGELASTCKALDLWLCNPMVSR